MSAGGLAYVPGGAGGVTTLTSTGGTIVITNPGGPSVNIETSSVSGSIPAYGNSVSASPATTVNDYAPAGFSATTAKLLLTAASGDTTITGLLSTGFVDGQTLVIRNVSAADNLLFSHLSGSSSAENQFNCSQALTQVIPPLSAATIMYLTGIGNWVFLS